MTEIILWFFFSSRRRHTRWPRDWSSDVCSSDLVVLKKGDSVAAILRELGATAEEVKAITAAFGVRGRDSSPKDGYKLRVLLAPGTVAARLRPVRVIIATDTNVEAMVAWSDMGKY